MEEMFDPEEDTNNAAAIKRLKEALNNSGDTTQRIIKDNVLKNEGGEDFVSNEGFHAGDLSSKQIEEAIQRLKEEGIETTTNISQIKIPFKHS